MFFTTYGIINNTDSKNNFTNIVKNEFETYNYLNDIDFFVISLRNLHRLTNIENQNKKLNANINIIDAVNGLDIDQNKLLKDATLSLFFSDIGNLKRNKEIGCFMSHEKIYKNIKENTNRKKYSLILEDDFNVIPEDISQSLNRLLQTIGTVDFDILFLGNTFDNVGLQIKDNVYSIDKNKYTIGNFAYLVNNSNIDKLITLIKPIDSPIDNKIDTLIKKDKLNCMVVYPNLFNYMIEITSEILQS
jgi:GR25 family glycosyltransferase involved in LPS biosynthesis